MNTIIKPASIRKQTDSVIQALQAHNSTLEAALPNITAFAEEPALQSESWNGLKSQIGAHQLVIKGLICANEDVIHDSETLASAVGTEYLNEDEINAEIERLESQNTAYTTRIANYRATIKRRRQSDSLTRSSSNLLLSNHYGMIGYCEKLISNNNEAIQELNDKLLEIERIINETEDLFSTSEDIYTAADQGLEELQGNFQGGSYGIISAGNWQTKLDKRWKEREVFIYKEAKAYLKEQGITDEEIKHLEDLGYDLPTLKTQWESVKDKEEDVEVFKLLLQGQYTNVFSRNPDILSDNMKTIMTNHFAQMITLPNAGEDEVHLSELEKVMSALIKHGESGNYEKNGLTIAALSETMATQSATIMLATNPSSNSYKQSEQLFNKYQALYNLTMGVMALDTPYVPITAAPDQGVIIEGWYSIKDLKVSDKGNLFFDLNYHHLDHNAIVDGDVSGATRITTKGTAFITNHGTAGGSLADHSSSITDILNKKDKLLEDTVFDIVGEAVGIFNPVLKLEIDSLKNVNNNDYSEIAKDIIGKASGISEHTKFLGNLAAIGNSLVEYQEKMGKLDAKQNEKTKKLFNEVLNTGSTSLDLSSTDAKDSAKIYSYPGIPDVQAVQAMNELNQNGFTNYLSETQRGELEALYKSTGERTTEEEKYILGVSDKELHELDPTELNSALNMLNEPEENGLENALEWLKDPANYSG